MVTSCTLCGPTSGRGWGEPHCSGSEAETCIMQRLQCTPRYAVCLVGSLHLCCSLLLRGDEECCAARHQVHQVLGVAQQWSGKVHKHLCSQRNFVGGCDQVAAP